MTIDELNEANGKRYGPDVMTILRLSSGRLAVLGVMQRLLGIVNTLEEAEDLSRSEALQYVLPPLSRKTLTTSKNAEDLGL